MHELSWILAAVFLPLFPLGMIFNAIFQRMTNVWGRVAIMLLWPLPGVWVMHNVPVAIPDWIVYWALFSALLYGFRAIVVKEFGVWIGFLATSTWALNWIGLTFGLKSDELLLHVLAFSLPLSMLILLVAELERRYESAYVSVISGLAQTQPKLSVLLVVSLLAAIGSPLFPAFFSMLDSVAEAVKVIPLIAFGLVTVWLLWSWSGISLLQQLLVGPASQVEHADISHSVTVIYISLLLLLILVGLYFSRILL